MRLLMIALTNYQYARAADCIMFERDESVVGMFERKGFDMRAGADARGLFEKLSPILARVVRHRAHDPLAVKKRVLERWDVAHVYESLTLQGR